MNIIVIGPGAIGTLWAYSLHQAGHCVSLRSRSTTATLSLNLNSCPTISFTNNSTDELLNADLILVTVKAPQVVAALKPLVSILHSDAIITLMHNGMGTAEQVAELFPENPLILATTTHGALRNSNAQVLHTGNGVTHLGSYNLKGKQCQFLSEVFQHALSEVVWSEEITHALWNKLAINCAINPLTAIHQIPNGELVNTHYDEDIEGIIQEITKVMRAEGIATDPTTVRSKVDTVIAATAKNRSSMHQDIAQQRPSEIDFITGYLIQRAQHHQIDVPTNIRLYNQIKHIEQGWKSS